MSRHRREYERHRELMERRERRPSFENRSERDSLDNGNGSGFDGHSFEYISLTTGEPVSPDNEPLRSLGDNENENVRFDLHLGNSQSRRGRRPNRSPFRSPARQESRHRSSVRPPPSRSTSPVPRYEVPVGRPPLPDGWIPQFDHRYQRWFYHNVYAGHSQWEAPGFEFPSKGRCSQHLQDRGDPQLSDSSSGLRNSRINARYSMDARGARHSEDLSDCRDCGDQRRSWSQKNAQKHEPYRRPAEQSRTRTQSRTRSHKHMISGTSKFLLGAASGIAAGALLARALDRSRSRTRTGHSREE